MFEQVAQKPTLTMSYESHIEAFLKGKTMKPMCSPQTNSSSKRELECKKERGQENGTKAAY